MWFTVRHSIVLLLDYICIRCGKNNAGCEKRNASIHEDATSSTSGKFPFSFDLIIFLKQAMQVNLVRVIDPLKIMNAQHTQTSILRFLAVRKAVTSSSI